MTSKYVGLPLETLWQEGLAAFNRRDFYDCHEYLEALWLQLPEGDERQLVQAVLQIAVGFHHWQNGNVVGARNKLKKGLARLAPLETRLNQAWQHWMTTIRSTLSLLAQTDAAHRTLPDIPDVDLVLDSATLLI